MPTGNPIQSQFKIRVFNGKLGKNIDNVRGSNALVASDDSYIDIEPCVALPVTYEEEASLLTTLKFTVDKYADLLLKYFYIGQSVLFFGGIYTGTDSSVRQIFSGSVTRIRTHFSDSGKVSFNVECMSYGFNKLGKNIKTFVYPDSESSRKFARKDSLSIEDIVKGIASEVGIEIGRLELSSEAKSIRMTKDSIEYQKEITDWNFLRMLAQKAAAEVWISNEDGTDKLNFVSSGKAFSKQSEITFLYPLYGVITDIRDSEIQKGTVKEYNRPRILHELNVDEDISSAYAVTRSAQFFDKSTGEYKEVTAQITSKNGKNEIVFYDLDEQRVAEVENSEDPRMKEIADKIRSGSPTSLEWGTPGDGNPEHASYYYKEIKKYDESMAVFDRAFFGITVTGWVNLDLDIVSQKTYKIRGILSYNSDSLETSFFLRGLKHVWDTDGCKTELDFIR